MHNRLTPDTEKRIQALCNEITGTYDSDDELRQEMRDHIEDKVLAYLDGKQVLSEADALILAEAHFGNRKKTRSLLRRIQGPRIPASMCRWIAAAAIATLAVGGVMRVASMTVLLLISALWPPYLKEIGREAGAMFTALYFYGTIWPNLAAVIITPVVTWWVLFRWKRQLRNGHELWFLRWPAWALTIAFIAVFLPQSVLGLMGTTRWIWAIPLGDLTYLSPSELKAFFAARQVAWLSVVAIPLLWLWWCDLPSRHFRAIGATLSIWMGLMTVSSLLDARFVFFVKDAPIHNLMPILRIGLLELRWCPPGLNLIEDAIGTLFFCLPLVFLACLGYLLFSRPFHRDRMLDPKTVRHCDQHVVIQ